MNLTSKRCVPCDGNVPRLDAQQTARLLGDLQGWTAGDEKLHKTYRFADFRTAMRFLDRVAELAEREGHHPDFCVHYNRVDMTVWTHAINGLSENDFILAAKMDAVLQ